MKDEHTEIESVPMPEEVPQEILPVEDPTTPPQNEGHVPTIPQLCVALGILLIVFSVPYVAPLFHFTKKTTQGERTTTAPHRDPSALTFNTEIFNDVQIEAEAAYVWDVATQRALYNKNAHAQLPLASLTKLMTGLISYETEDSNATVSIPLSAIKQNGENGFTEGETWKKEELLGFTLVTSSNDGAYALAASAGTLLQKENLSPEQSFVSAMNAKAEEIGLSQTYFTNPTGLDASDSQSGSYGSARDMAFLMEYIITKEPDLLTDTTKPVVQFSDSEGIAFSAVNTNQDIAVLDNPLGSKTGYTTLAGGNLVVAFDVGLNHPIVISVLGSSREGRFADVSALIERAKKYYVPTP